MASIQGSHIPTSLTIQDTNPSTVTSSAAQGASLLQPDLASNQESTSTSHITSTANNSRRLRVNPLRQLNNRNVTATASRCIQSTRDDQSSHNGRDTVLHVHRQNHNSSKLPAFRFADLSKDALVPATLIHSPQLPVALKPAPATSARRSITETQEVDRSQLGPHSSSQRSNFQPIQDLLRDSQDQTIVSSPKQIQPSAAKQSKHIPTLPANPTSRSPPAVSLAGSLRSGSSTIDIEPSTDSKSLGSPSPSSKRPSSYPDGPAAVAKLSGAATTPSAISGSQQPGILDIASPENNNTSSGRRPNLAHTRRTVSDGATKDWAQGRRELLLPKTVDSSKSDDRRRSRPPVSFRQPNIAAAAAPGRPVIPPIRSFRSSGSRKSLVLDMNTRRVSLDESSDGFGDADQRDRTLRALEGRADDDYSQFSPPESAYATPDENTSELFLRIANEDSSPQRRRESGAAEEYSGPALTRLRSSQRRPTSDALSSKQVSSPPQIPRRLSEQPRTRRATNELPAQQMTRELNYRAVTREQPPPAPARRIEEPPRTQPGRMSALRPSPITPRTSAFQDIQSEVGSAYSRRRTSVTEGSGGLSSRSSHLRSANLSNGQGRIYNSSPLVPRSVDLSSNYNHPQQHEAHHAGEGTESSTGSTAAAAPSMIWDELDDLKSRIHRLELTGKQPATSAQAMSRASEERPPTAVTNATTVSASPKRTSPKRSVGTMQAQADDMSTTSSQREAQPILLAALSKTKALVSPDVYDAIESAANDALALTSMMGAAGQPGPISSGASTIGGSGGVTDRQLRKKAESICRSLTELCLALADEATVKVPYVVPFTPREDEIPISPTTVKYSSISRPRQPSIVAEPAMARANPASRAPTSLEQRRMTLLSNTALTSPRSVLASATTADATGPGRKSSLLLARTRRAGTEEPEEQSGRKSSLVLRTRRAGTEEPEEGRKTSLLLRSRRGTINDGDELSLRAPSRATTEVSQLRNVPRDYISQQEPTSSALPRRRLAPTGLNSRLVPPSSPAVATPPASTTGRRFLERHTPDRDTSSATERLAEDRAQRQFSMSHTAMLNRTSSISRRRDSAIPTISTSASQVGSYRS